LEGIRIPLPFKFKAAIFYIFSSRLFIGGKGDVDGFGFNRISFNTPDHGIFEVDRVIKKALKLLQVILLQRGARVFLEEPIPLFSKVLQFLSSLGKGIFFYLSVKRVKLSGQEKET
jgi:hypothetical protein